MNEKELAIRLVRNAAETQRRAPSTSTEANRDPEIRAVGNAAIANALEFLGRHQVVADVQPTFGSAGMGFAYVIRPELLQNLATDEGLTAHIEELFSGPKSQTTETIRALVQSCGRRGINIVYRDDLLTSLKELEICFREGCFIASLALSGKILEICLKQVLIDRRVTFGEKAMIGTLLDLVREAAPDIYLDQSLGEIGKVINQSRIPAVHAKERIPVPSRDQAIMVIHAIADTLNRTLLRP